MTTLRAGWAGIEYRQGNRLRSPPKCPDEWRAWCERDCQQSSAEVQTVSSCRHGVVACRCVVAVGVVMPEAFWGALGGFRGLLGQVERRKGR